MLTRERLKAVLHYEPETGVFTRLACFQRPDVTGKQTSNNAGGNGYTRICIDGKRYYLHRIAWLYMTGDWPKDEIDHLDGNRTNNRWGNLREATSSLNKQNVRHARCDSQSGILGVSWDSQRGKWTVRILVGGIYKFCGRFEDRELARAAYVSAKRKYHAGCTI